MVALNSTFTSNVPLRPRRLALASARSSAWSQPWACEAVTFFTSTLPLTLGIVPPVVGNSGTITRSGALRLAHGRRGELRRSEGSDDVSLLLVELHGPLQCINGVILRVGQAQRLGKVHDRIGA